MNIESVIKEIQNYIPQDQEEKTCQKEMLSFLDRQQNRAFLRENEKAHFSASCMVINEEETKVLFVYHLIYQSWSFIGGHADGNPDLFSVAIKEVKEETGVTPIEAPSKIVAIQKLYVPAHIKKGKKIKEHIHYDVCYLFKAKENTRIKAKLDENQDVRWIPISDLSTFVTEKHMLPIYKKILRRIKK